jgi:hypothetical protein
MTAELKKMVGDESKGGTLALVLSVFIKYGSTPLVCVLFAYWLQGKDERLNDRYVESVRLAERTTLVIEGNTAALQNLTRELREKRN